MQPSSLILLAIIVVWAAYLVPQWVRRRDEMSQSRDNDRFSGGLRVLKRRNRSGRSGRSGDPLLTSPRVIVDTDGELLYIPADRLLSERLAGSSMSLPQSAQPGETLAGVADKNNQLEDAGEPDPSVAAGGDVAGSVTTGSVTTGAVTAEADPAGADLEDGAPTAPVRRADLVFDRMADERSADSSEAPVVVDDAAGIARDGAAGVVRGSSSRVVLSSSAGVVLSGSGDLVRGGAAERAVPAGVVVDAAGNVVRDGAREVSRDGAAGVVQDGAAGVAAARTGAAGNVAAQDVVAAYVPTEDVARSITAQDIAPSETTPSNTAVGNGTVAGAQPSHAAPPATDAMAELEAGLLAGFGLTATAAPVAQVPQVEAMPTVQPPHPPQVRDPAPATTGVPHSPSSTKSQEMADLEAGLLAGFGITAPAAETPPPPAEPRSGSRRAAPTAPSGTTEPSGRAEGESFAEEPRPRRTSPTRPRRQAADFVPGTERVPPSGSETTDDEPAWVVEPRVTTSSPISASAEAAQESYQALADPEVSQESEYSTTHADLDAARLSARLAASRRARSMAVLFVATIAAWVFMVVGSVPVFIAVAATLLLSAHAVASRTAAVRSRETLTMLAAHLYAAEMAREHAEKRRRQAAARTRARAEAEAAAPVPERVARRAAAVSSDTWDPIPVPPPTYQLKPAVHRPEPPPLETPVEKPASKPQQSPAAEERQVSRGSMPRRAADIERILKLDEELPRAVNE